MNGVNIYLFGFAGGVLSCSRPAGTHTTPAGRLRRSATRTQAVGRLDKGNGEFDDD